MSFLREHKFISNVIYESLVKHFEANIFGDLVVFEKSLLSFNQAPEAILKLMEMGEKEREKREKEEKEIAAIVVDATFEMSRGLKELKKEYQELRKKNDKDPMLE